MDSTTKALVHFVYDQFTEQQYHPPLCLLLETTDALLQRN